MTTEEEKVDFVRMFENGESFPIDEEDAQALTTTKERETP